MSRFLLAIAILALAAAIAFLALSISDDDDDELVVSGQPTATPEPLLPLLEETPEATVPPDSVLIPTVVPDPSLTPTPGGSASEPAATAAPDLAPAGPTATPIGDLPPLVAGEAVRLTDSENGAFDPAWDPAGDTIAYMVRQGAACCSDIGGVQSDGSGEGTIASGPQSGFGIGASLSWVGTTGLVMTNERVVFHEYMTVDASLAPFARAAADGNDDAFTRKLLIPGGSGGDAVDVSRDGSTVAWRHRQGTTVPVTLRVASFDSLSGQNTDGHGTVLATDTADPTAFVFGFGLSPDGSQIVVSEVSGDGNDLFLYRTDGAGDRVQLTNTGLVSGLLNRGPCYSPDGQSIAFYTSDGTQNDLWLLRLTGNSLTQLTQLTATDAFSEANPSWSPDGTRIAFQGAVPGETSNIYVMTIE